MNIIITCGHPYSGFQSVHTILTEAGLAQADLSKREGMGTSEFHQRVLAAHGVDLTVPTSLAAVTPGRVWDDLAVDLFLGNLDAPDWGWADAGTVWLLDFWSQFDPRIRFVLVYAPPEHVVAEMLRQGALSSEDIAPAMASWAAYHVELLRFFHRHPDRCILVDFTAASSMQRRLVTKVADGFGLHLDASRVAQDTDGPSMSVLEVLLVRGLLPRDTEAGVIYAEMEAAAGLSSDSDPLPANFVHAWSEYVHLLTRLQRSAEQAQHLREATARLEREGVHAKRAKSEAQAADVTAENELLLLQLHELQLELEKCYLQCRTQEDAEKQRQTLETTVATERAKQSELAEEIKRLQAEVAVGEAAATQLTAKQKELDVQVTARTQVEQLLAEAERRTEDVSRQLIAAKAAHSATEETLRQTAAKEAALTKASESLLLQLQEVQEESKQYYLKCQTLEEVDRRRQLVEATLTTERAKHAELADQIKRLQAEVTQGETATKQLATKQRELDGQVAGRKEAELRLAEITRQLEGAFHELSAARAAHNATEEALRHEVSKATELAQENEFLVLQLHQVQEELERYYPALAGEQLTQTTVDLREEINGKNWYDAEEDGRWAGPGQISTLVLPGLTVGQYQLTLEVVDAIEPEVLNGMVLSLNGKPLAIKRRSRGSLTLVTAKFFSETSTPGEKWELALSFPRLRSPAERGSDDHRTLAVRVRTLSIVPIGTESGSPVADASAYGKWDVVQPTQVTFDLRGPIDGDNWYDAEHDGRWAGPGHVSTLMLPALGAGRYQMELDVVDAMAPEIVNGMTVSLNGKPVAVNPKCRGYPTLVTAEFSTDMPAPDGQWELRISFPRVASPADHGSDDHRTLAIRLRTVSIKEIRPGEDLTALQLGGKRGSTKGSRKSYRWWPHRK